MQITETTILLGHLNPPSIWNFYDHPALAAADLNRANETNRATYPDAPSYQVLTYGQYKAAEAAFYLADPPQEITQEAWQQMFTCLPPKAYQHAEDWESFLCEEHMSGPFTYQYVRHGERYYSKIVNSLNRYTWMTRESVSK